MIFGLCVLVVGADVGMLLESQLHGLLDLAPTKNLKVFNFYFHIKHYTFTGEKSLKPLFLCYQQIPIVL